MMGAGVDPTGDELRVAFAVRRGQRSTLTQVASGSHVALPARPRRTLAALPLARTTHRVLDVPFTDDPTLAQVIPLELRGQLPLDASDARLGFEVVARDASSARVLALLVRERDLEAAASAASRSGLPATGLVPGPLALRWLLPAGFTGTVLLADGSASSVAVWEAGVPRSLRALAADARHTPALLEELRWSLAAMGGTGGPLVVAGADASPALLEQCRRLDPAADLLPVGHLALDLDAVRVLASPVACALALGALDKQARPAFPLAAAAAPLLTPRLRRLAVAVVLMAAFDLALARFELARRAGRMEAALVAEVARALPGEPIVAPRAQLEAAASSSRRHGGTAAYGTALARLREVSERIPEGLSMDLTRLTLEGERLQLVGNAATFEAVDVLRRALTASPRLRDVAADEVRTTVDGKRVSFHVRARWVAAGEASS